MSSTFSTDLKIELITTGDQSGTWGDTTNNNFSNVFEQAIVGLGNPDFVADANLTLAYLNTVAIQTARNLYLNVTSSVAGGLTAQRDLIVPTINKTYIVKNNTTGSQNIRVKTSAGTGVIIPPGFLCAVYVDGTSVGQAFDYLPEFATVALIADSINAATIAATGAITGASLAVTGTASANRLTSTVATGTSPLVVSSTTKVTNLNADLLDGLSAADFDPAGSAIVYAIALG